MNYSVLVQIYIIQTLIIIIFFFKFNKLSSILNSFDFPNERKNHKFPVPLIGGFFLAINILFLIFYLHIFLPGEIEFNIPFFLFGYLSFFLIGFYDDKFNLNANIKLFLSILILLPIVYLDSNTKLTVLRFSFLENELNLNNFNIFITILFFLLFINAFNMFDGLNCQNGLYSVILIIILLIFSYKNIFLFGLLLSLIIFNYFNFKSKFFLGDSGSLSLGFLFSYFFTMYYNKEIINFSDQIYLYMFLPGLDLMRLYLFRLAKKKSPFKPDRNHLNHYFLESYGYIKTLAIILLFIAIPVIIDFFLNKTLIINILSLLLYLYLIFFKFKGNFNLIKK